MAAGLIAKALQTLKIGIGTGGRLAKAGQAGFQATRGSGIKGFFEALKGGGKGIAEAFKALGTSKLGLARRSALLKTGAAFAALPVLNGLRKG